MSDQEMNDEKFELGLSFHQQGNPDQAEMIYREVLNGNPNHKHAWSNLGAILSKKTNLKKQSIAIGRRWKLTSSLANAGST